MYKTNSKFTNYINILILLYNDEEVNANNVRKYTTRVTNETDILRNRLNIKIDTVRVNLANGKHYGNYKLVRTKENIEKVEKIILNLSSRVPTKTALV